MNLYLKISSKLLPTLLKNDPVTAVDRLVIKHGTETLVGSQTLTFGDCVAGSWLSLCTDSDSAQRAPSHL